VKCLLCEGATSAFDDPQLGITYHQCDQCELIFKDPSHFPTVSREKAQYDHHNNSLDNEGYVQMFETFIGFALQEAIPKTALDFGSGPTPVLAALLSRRTIQTDHFDPIYAPTLPDHTYDLITSTEVFEHLHDPHTTLKQIIQRLNKEGYLAIMTQFHPNNRDQFLKWWYRRDPTHVLFFRPKTFATIAQKYKFAYIDDDGKKSVLLKKL
jgi:SAM-dependent methyltransferase